MGASYRARCEWRVRRGWKGIVQEGQKGRGVASKLPC